MSHTNGTQQKLVRELVQLRDERRKEYHRNPLSSISQRYRELAVRFNHLAAEELNCDPIIAMLIIDIARETGGTT